jgi:uncharacterized protein YbjT (DUF2867 family)
MTFALINQFMMSNRILVIGSTGKTGSRIFNGLQSLGEDAVPGSRQSEKPFDWYQENTWAAVLSGIDSVYISFQPDLAVPGSLEIVTRFVDVAKPAGVTKLVLLSGRGEKEAQACEDVVMRSGLQCTILRASFFMQNFSEGFWADGIASRDFVIPQIKSREPFLDIDDLAEIAIQALITNNHNGKVYELTGPELLSFQDVISKISAQLDVHIQFTEIPLTDYSKMLRSFHVPEDVIWLIEYLFAEVLDGRNESISHDIENVLGRKASSFDNYIRKTVDAGMWSVQNEISSNN